LALTRRQVAREFKLPVMREVEAGKPLAQVAREYHVPPTVIRRWQQEHQHDAERAFAGQGHSYQEEARIAELERLVGQLTMENARRKKALRRLEARGHGPTGTGGS
jgi:transposase